jgi:hypothetical protein
LPTFAQASGNSRQFVEAFGKLGFTPQSVLGRFNTRADWDIRARILTDQYSPANLLNGATR